MTRPTRHGTVLALGSKRLAEQEALAIAASRALSVGDPLAALRLTHGARGAPALALRGIALAQLDELESAERCLTRGCAGLMNPLLRGRTRAALGEVLAARRDLRRAPRTLRTAAAELKRLGDRANAGWTSLVLARLCVVAGDVLGARRALLEAEGNAEGQGPVLAAAVELAHAEQAIAALRPDEAERSLERVGPLRQLPALGREADRLRALLSTPVGALGGQPATLSAVARSLGGPGLVLDGFRRVLWVDGAPRSLGHRPTLFALLRVLGDCAPGTASAELLLREAYEVRAPNASHRARLRVAMYRLRKVTRGTGPLEAAGGGYRWRLTRTPVLAMPNGSAGALRVLLADGAAWTVPDLCRASGLLPRTAQRALAELVSEGTLASFGQARARRYLLAGGLASPMLLRGLMRFP
ncbi:MAG: hypothetical protein ACYC8T_31705 [Myxococcaceae bacterium]